MKRFIACVLAALAFAGAASAQEHGPVLDRFPVDRTTELPALQNGARLFVNYCLTCHSASYMRYNRMKEIGLSEQQIGLRIRLDLRLAARPGPAEATGPPILGGLGGPVRSSPRHHGCPAPSFGRTAP